MMSYGTTPMGGESLDAMRARLAEKEAQENEQRQFWQQRNAALLEAAKQRQESEEAEKAQKLQELREQAFDREHKERAKRQWLMTGGTPAGFEESWPSIKQEFIRRKVAEDLQAASYQIASYYRDL